MNSRTRLLALISLSTVLLTACASGGYSGQTLQNAPYFINYRLVTVDTDYIDRYACSDGALLTCQRTASRLSSTAVCKCR